MSEAGHLRNEDLLRAVGAFIDQGGWRDVVVLQLRDGIMLKGSRVERVGDEDVIELIDATVLTEDDVRNILRASRQRRRASIQRIGSEQRRSPGEQPSAGSSVQRRWPFGATTKTSPH